MGHDNEMPSARLLINPRDRSARFLKYKIFTDFPWQNSQNVVVACSNRKGEKHPKRLALYDLVPLRDLRDNDASLARTDLD
jgi:hypothetical protein